MYPTQGFRVGRFLNTGSDIVHAKILHRDYAFISNLSEKYKNVSHDLILQVKPGRHESVTLTGAINNSAMTSIDLIAS